ncbi:MAG: hypothetical protein KKG00_06445, partial [Bacteroidetes bacterium]|nr:hypothetical protein [Bacteroidota bacterium]
MNSSLGMYFTDATHGWVVGGDIKAFKPAPAVCASNQVVVNPKTPTATLSGTQTINAGQSANLSVSFTGNAPYALVFNGQTYSNITANPYTFTVSPTATTTYTLTSVSNACGAGTVSGSAVVTVNPACQLPTAILSGTQTINAGEYATLTVKSTGEPSFTIMVNGETHSNISTTYTFTVNPTTTTTYTLTSVSNACGAGTVSGSAVVTVNGTNSTEVYSIKTGSWHDPGTWNCSCVPNNTQTVEIKQ